MQNDWHHDTFEYLSISLKSKISNLAIANDGALARPIRSPTRFEPKSMSTPSPSTHYVNPATGAIMPIDVEDQGCDPLPDACGNDHRAQKLIDRQERAQWTPDQKLSLGKICSRERNLIIACVLIVVLMNFAHFVLARDFESVDIMIVHTCIYYVVLDRQNAIFMSNKWEKIIDF